MQISEVFSNLKGKLNQYIIGSNTAPLSSSDIERIYGKGSDFLEAYQDFQEEFLQAVLESQSGTNTPVLNPDGNFLSNGLDFNMIKDVKTRRRLEDKFKRRILNLPKLLKHGLPTASVPSSNPYRATLRYMLTGDDQSSGFRHPAEVILSRLNFNFNPSANGLSAISIGRKMLSANQLETAFLGGGRVAPPTSGLKRVLTLDIETTGVTDSSVGRTFAISETFINSKGETVDAAGNLGAKPKLLSNIFLDVPDISSEVVGTAQGSIPMSQFLIDREITGIGAPGVSRVVSGDSDELLSGLEDILRQLNSADAVVTQNAKFDIGKLLQTIQSIDGYRSHKGLMEQLEIFEQKTSEIGFINDQLIAVSDYLQRQATSLIGEGLDQEEFSTEIGRVLYGRLPGQPVAAGEGLTYASVTATAQNTNLLDLIRRDAPEVFNEIHSGSHIAATDVIIEDYIRKYMQSGELKLDEYARRDIKNGVVDEKSSYLNDAEIKKARDVVRRSSAINASTDIADVRLMSDTAFRSVVDQDRFLQRTTVSGTITPQVGTPSTILKTGRVVYRDPEGQFFPPPADLKGEFFFDAQSGEYRFSTAEMIFTADELDTLGYSQGLIKGEIKQTLESARVGDEEAIDRIIRSGITYGTSSNISRVEDLGLLDIGRRAANINLSALSDDQIADALGSVYENFGERRSVGTVFGNALGRILFGSGLGRYSAGTVKSVANSFADLGYGYFSSPEERVISTIIAEKTSRLGSAVSSAAVSSSADISNIKYTARAEDLVEMGLSYFRAGGKRNARTLIGQTSDLSEKLIIPLKIVEQAVQDVAARGDSVAQLMESAAMLNGRVSLDDVGLSFADIGGQRGVNVVWNTGRVLGQDESMALAEALYDIFSDEDRVREIMDLGLDEDLGRLGEIIGEIEQTKANGTQGREDALKTIQRRLSDGIAVGNLDLAENEVLEMESALGRQQVDTATDVVSSRVSTRILASDLQDDAGQVGVLAPVRNYEEAQRLGDEASKLILETDAKYLDTVGQLAERLDQSPDLGKRVTKKISSSVDGSDYYKAVEIYQKYKKPGIIGLGIAGVAAAGYYAYRRSQENDLYDETLEQQPYEDRLNKYSLGESFDLSNGSRLNPMSTTSTVNDLNNRRINHTNMSNSKNDHLFSGAL